MKQQINEMDSTTERCSTLTNNIIAYQQYKKPSSNNQIVFKISCAIMLIVNIWIGWYFIGQLIQLSKARSENHQLSNTISLLESDKVSSPTQEVLKLSSKIPQLSNSIEEFRTEFLIQQDKLDSVCQQKISQQRAKYKKAHSQLKTKLQSTLESTLKQKQKQINSKISSNKKQLQKKQQQIISENCEKKISQKKSQIPFKINQINQNCRMKMNELHYPYEEQIDKLRGRTYPTWQIIIQNRNKIYLPSQQKLRTLQSEKDLIIVTEAEQAINLRILYKYLKKQSSKFLQWHLWVKKSVEAKDLQFMKKIQRQNKWIKIITLNDTKNRNPQNSELVDFHFEDNIKDKIYLKLSQRIVWMEQDFIQNMFKNRFKLSKHLFVVPNIINNGVIDYIHHRTKATQFPQNLNYHFEGKNVQSQQVAIFVHKEFIKSIQQNKTSKWKSFKQWKLLQYERITTSAFMYFSDTYNSLQYIEQIDWQRLFTQKYTSKYSTAGTVVSQPLCVYGYYNGQKPYYQINNNNLLRKYRTIADKL